MCACKYRIYIYTPYIYIPYIYIYLFIYNVKYMYTRYIHTHAHTHTHIYIYNPYPQAQTAPFLFIFRFEPSLFSCSWNHGFFAHPRLRGPPRWIIQVAQVEFSRVLDPYLKCTQTVFPLYPNGSKWYVHSHFRSKCCISIRDSYHLISPCPNVVFPLFSSSRKTLCIRKVWSG